MCPAGMYKGIFYRSGELTGAFPLQAEAFPLSNVSALQVCLCWCSDSSASRAQVSYKMYLREVKIASHL